MYQCLPKHSPVRLVAGRRVSLLWMYGFALYLVSQSAGAKEPIVEVDPQQGWIQRAISLAVASQDSISIANAYLYEAIWFVGHGEFAAAMNSLSHCENGAPKYYSLIAFHFVGLGRAETAIAFARFIPNSEARQKTLGAIACSLSDQYQFDQAKAILPEISSETAAHAALYMASKQIRAGKYAEAQVTVDSIQFEGSSTPRKGVSDVRSFIEAGRRLNLKELPYEPNCSLAERYRRLLDGYWQPTLNCDDMPAAERQAAETNSIPFRQATWRAIAWIYLRKGQVADAIRAKQQWEVGIQQITIPEIIPWLYILLADFELDLGAKPDAQKHIERAIQSQGEAGISGILADETNGPFAVAVLVRCGKARLVRDLAGKLPQSENVLWISLAAFCWAQNERELIDEVLDNPSLPNTLKSNVCLGVVQAMQHSLNR